MSHRFAARVLIGLVVALSGCDDFEPFGTSQIEFTSQFASYAVGTRGAAHFQNKCAVSDDPYLCDRKSVREPSASFADPGIFELISVGPPVTFDVLAPGKTDLTVTGTVDGEVKTASMKLTAREIDEIRLVGPDCDLEGEYLYRAPGSIEIRASPYGDGELLYGEGSFELKYELPEGVTVNELDENRRHFFVSSDTSPGTSIRVRPVVGGDSREFHIVDSPPLERITAVLTGPDIEPRVGGRPILTAEFQFESLVCNPREVAWAAFAGPPDVCVTALDVSVPSEGRYKADLKLVGAGVCEVSVEGHIDGDVFRDSDSFEVLEAREVTPEGEDAGP